MCANQDYLSPYLQRPLRSYQQVLRERAEQPRQTQALKRHKARSHASSPNSVICRLRPFVPNGAGFIGPNRRVSVPT